MRHGASARRMRGRSNNNGHNHGQNNQRRGFQNNKNRVFDSNGPDVRIRGTAFQIVEKYATLSKDDNSTGDRVLAESYLQNDEHYQRMISEWGVEEAYDDNVNEQRFEIPPPAGVGPQPGMNGAEGAEDLGLPSSILGARKATEMAEA